LSRSTSGLSMAAADNTILPAEVSAGSSTLRLKPSRKKPDTSSEWHCLKCNKHFSFKGVLTRHEKQCCGNVNTILHSSIEVSPTIPTPTVTNVPRPRHTCSICHKSFVNKGDFVYHIKSYHPSTSVDTVSHTKRIKALKCPGQHNVI